MLSTGTEAGNRQVQKTLNLLRNALSDLIREKDYDAITVREILERANVGRSTFYTHFRDKDELLVSGIHEMVRLVRSAEPAPSAKRYERILRFSLPIFEYHYHHRRMYEDHMGIRGRAIIHKHLENALAEIIADDVMDDLQGRLRTDGRISRELLIRFVASTFHLVLNWWGEARDPLPPKEVNDVFRALVLPTLEGVWQ